MTAVRQIKRKAAKRPAQRTVSVILAGDFAGWEATARADFPARWIAEFNEADTDHLVKFLDRIVIDHNMPDSDDEIAATMADVDPVDGLIAMADAIMDELAKLPKR